MGTITDSKYDRLPQEDRATKPPSQISTLDKLLRWLPWLSLPVLVWALWPYPKLLMKNAQEAYLMDFSWGILLEFALGFYGLYLLPGLALFFWRGRKSEHNPFLSFHRVLLAFALGILAHTLAIFIQKYIGLGFSPLVILVCLLFSYGALVCLLRPLEFITQEKPSGREMPWLTWGLLLMAWILGTEMILRGRASSFSLMGDAYAHLISMTATLEGGPLPDGLPFYSTFILNIHPMSFHSMMANLYSLLPGTEAMDFLRYFSVIMLPLVLSILFALFYLLGKNRPIAALGTLALVFIAGGGLSLKVPIVFFPWYWAMAWALSGAVVYLLLLDGLKNLKISFWAGVLLGVTVLIHPMVAPRMGTILCFFLPLEIIRRVLTGQNWKAVPANAILFILGAAIPVSIWILPLILRFGWEETYSYGYIVNQFKDIAPKGVDYIQSLKTQSFNWADLYSWTKEFGGLFLIILFPLGIVASIKNKYQMASSLLLAWVMAMASAIIFAYLPNPYRYFEYFFLGLLALGVYGLAWAYGALPSKGRALLLTLILVLSFVGIRRDFWPKYQKALQHYGRTTRVQNPYGRSRHLVLVYQKSRREGNLDKDFGEFRGYLWSRQKKVWDIYVANKRNKIRKPLPPPQEFKGPK